MSDYSFRVRSRCGRDRPLLFVGSAFVLLMACFGLAAGASTSNEILARQEPPLPAQEQKPDPDRDKPPAKILLADGTPIRLRFARKVFSSEVIAGEKIPLEASEPVLVGEWVAIRQHSEQQAIVTMAQAGRSLGRGGNLQFKIENVRLADGELVPVRATKDVKGGGNRVAALTGEAGMIAGFAFGPASPLGFFIYARGKNATIPAGAEITAYTTGDFQLDPAKFRENAAAQPEKNTTR